MSLIYRGLKPMKEKEKHTKGFSLIEVLATIFILGAILISLLGVFVYGFNLVSRTRQTNLATQIAQEEVERFRNMDFDLIISGTSATTDLSTFSPSEYPSLFGPSPDYNLLLVNGTQTVTVEPVDEAIEDEIKKLTVTITWVYRTVTQQKHIVTYLYNDGISNKI